MVLLLGLVKMGGATPTVGTHALRCSLGSIAGPRHLREHPSLYPEEINEKKTHLKTQSNWNSQAKGSQSKLLFKDKLAQLSSVVTPNA